MASLFPTWRQEKEGRKFFLKNVDMRCSFEGLKEIAVTRLGCDFLAGDMCYFENTNLTRRKALIYKDGVIYQLYWMKVKGKFIEIYQGDGLITEYIDFKE